MQIRYRFSWKTTLVCGVLALLMIRAAFWQWERHLQKEVLVAAMQKRLSRPVVNLRKVLADPMNEEWLYRRVAVHGEYDFAHETVLRNRKHPAEGAGVHVLTPLKVFKTDSHVLIDRGFVPITYKSKEKRAEFQRSGEHTFVGLIKPLDTKKFLSPPDPPIARGWVDEWLRVDIPKMEKQLPYRLPRFYIEIMSDADPGSAINKVVSTSSGRQDIFFITNESRRVSTGELNPEETYPIPSHSAIIPSATHLSYVFEWSIMALFTVLIGIVLQLKRHEYS